MLGPESRPSQDSSHNQLLQLLIYPGSLHFQRGTQALRDTSPWHTRPSSNCLTDRYGTQGHIGTPGQSSNQTMAHKAIRGNSSPIPLYYACLCSHSTFKRAGKSAANLGALALHFHTVWSADPHLKHLWLLLYHSLVAKDKYILSAGT